MLKIKDNVNLDELLKYGFEYCGQVRYLQKYTYTSRCGTTTYRVWIKRDRSLSIHNPTSVVFNLVYDLIKDGLVEKV